MPRRSRHRWARAIRRPVSQSRPPLPPPIGSRVATSDTMLGRVLLPLRLFLGVTFVYAGLQKISDGGFFHAGSRTYIGAQLQGYATHSPLGGLFAWLGTNLAVEKGLVVIAIELAVGVAVLVGFRTRWFAAAGAALNLLLFFSATWDVSPYFLGSDSIYAVAWITLAIAGDGGVWTVARHWRFAVEAPVDQRRRAALVQLGSAAVAAIWLLGLLPRGRTASAVSLNPAASPSPDATAAAQPTATSATTPSPTSTPAPASPPAGVRIGALADLQHQGSLGYQDPKSGDPAIAVALGNNQVVAYDAVCTHAGCTVQYYPPQRVLYCPCHGAVFDPAQNATVLQGPAPTPLAPLKVTVASDGGVYAEG